jgi:hypothetical protein
MQSHSRLFASQVFIRKSTYLHWTWIGFLNGSGKGLAGTWGFDLKHRQKSSHIINDEMMTIVYYST